jgi:hypothetical protein
MHGSQHDDSVDEIQEIRDEEEDSNDFYSNYGEEYDEGGGWGGEGEQPLQQPVPTPSGSRGEGGQPGSDFLDPDPGSGIVFFQIPDFNPFFLRAKSSENFLGYPYYLNSLSID